MLSRVRILIISNSFPFVRRACLSLAIAAAPGLSGPLIEALAEEGSDIETVRGLKEPAQPDGAPNSLPTVVISAAPLAPSLLEFSRPASVIRGQQLDERVRSTLGETIDLQPGVRSSFFGAGASRPVIRGFSGERVRTLRNGVSTGDVSSVSEDHVVVADPLQAEQVEILRGPETLLFGSSAIGGAVNVTDDSIPEVSLGKPFEGTILGQFGNSADNEKSEALRLRGESGGINWYGSAFSRKTDSYEIPGLAESKELRAREEMSEEHAHGEELVLEQDGEASEGNRGVVENSDSKTVGATFGASHIFNEGFVGVAVSGFDSSYGVPGHAHEDAEGDEHHLLREADESGLAMSRRGAMSRGAGVILQGQAPSAEEGRKTLEGAGVDVEDDVVRIEAQQLRGDVRGRYDTKGLIDSVRFRMGATNYEHTEYDGGVVGTVYGKDAIEVRTDLSHRSFGPISGVIGLHGIYDDFSATGEEAFLPQTRSVTQALFLFENIEITDAFSLQAGGRIESVVHDPMGRVSYDGHPTSVSGGFLWDIDSEGMYSLSSSLAYAERAPSPVELYAEGIHYARRIREQGNSSLSNERSTGVDLALRKNTGFLTASFTPFYQYFEDYINLRGREGPEEAFPLYTYEETGATFWGGEFVSSLHLDEIVSLCGHRLTFDFQTDIVRSRDRDRDSSIPRTPPLRNIVRARWEHPSAVQLMVEGVMVDAQRRLAVEEIPTDGYSLINSEVSYRIGEAARSVRLFLRGTNLTNEEARVHTSFLKDLAPLRGRSFLVGFRGTF